MQMSPTIFSTLVIAMVAVASAEAAPAISACTLLTKAELRPFIKNRVFDQFPAEEDRVGTGTGCNYAGVVIQLDPFPFSVVESTWSKEKGNFESVPGLGDAAYFHRNARAEAAEIAVRVGQRVFTAQVDLDQGESMDAAKTRAIGLARVAAAKLR